MTHQLTYRAATKEDVSIIIDLLRDDEFGKTRENGGEEVAPCYLIAFEEISKDPNHYLMVVEWDGTIVGTCHLLIYPHCLFKDQPA
jgi:hypothetical protein